MFTKKMYWYFTAFSIVKSGSRDHATNSQKIFGGLGKDLPSKKRKSLFFVNLYRIFSFCSSIFLPVDIPGRQRPFCRSFPGPVSQWQCAARAFILPANRPLPPHRRPRPQSSARSFERPDRRSSRRQIPERTVRTGPAGAQRQKTLGTAPPA